MPAYQTTYTINPAVAYAGMIGDTEFTTALSCEITTGAVGFGLAVGRGAADRTARLGGAGYVGITIADKADPEASYGVGDIAGVLVRGAIWVTAGAAVTPADSVFFNAATGVISNISAGGTAIPNARFLTSAANGALVLLMLN